MMSHVERALERVGANISPDCKICGESSQAYDVVDFYKTCSYDLYPLGLSGIPIVYYKCSACEFIFTSFFDDFSPDQWREHVYNAEYATIDPDYLTKRPRDNARLIEALLTGRKNRTTGLDYGGGNGRTAALLRDAGWVFDTYDPFDRIDISPEHHGRYNFCSSFEVFEHSPDPVASLKDIVERTSRDRLMVLIGTAVHDGSVSDETRLSWLYAAPRNGHISLFSRRAMHIMAEKLGLRYMPMRGMNGTHLLSRGVSDMAARAFLLQGKARLKMRNIVDGLMQERH